MISRHARTCFEAIHTDQIDDAVNWIEPLAGAIGDNTPSSTRLFDDINPLRESKNIEIFRGIFELSTGTLYFASTCQKYEDISISSSFMNMLRGVYG